MISLSLYLFISLSLNSLSLYIFISLFLYLFISLSPYLSSLTSLGLKSQPLLVLLKSGSFLKQSYLELLLPLQCFLLNSFTNFSLLFLLVWEAQEAVQNHERQTAICEDFLNQYFFFRNLPNKKKLHNIFFSLKF